MDSELLKTVCKGVIVLAHSFKFMNDRISAAKDIIHEFPDLRSLEIRPEDYEDKDFWKAISDRSEIAAAIVPFNGKQELQRLISEFPRLEWVQIAGTGVKPFLELPGIVDSDLIITNLKSVSSELLAEFAIGGSLFFTKRFNEYLNFAEEGKWKDPTIYNINWMQGKTALIVGFGSIGSEIARKCKYGFGMKIIGLKKHPENIPESLAPFVDSCHSLSNLKEFIKDADYIFAALPEIEGMGVLFDEEAFSLMRPNAVFVNVGRGTYVDEHALIDCLKAGKIAGAALDVFSKEPLDSESPFYKDSDVRKRVLMTCHSIDHSYYLINKSKEMFKEMFSDYSQGKALKRIVNKKLGY